MRDVRPGVPLAGDGRLPGQGTPQRPRGGDNGHMNGAEVDRWASRALRDPRAPLAAGVALAIAAVLQVTLEPVARHAGSIPPASPPKIFLVLIALAATLPLGLLRAQPRTAAVVIVVAELVLLGLAHVSTVGGLISLLAAVAWLGYLGAQALSACAAVAFLVLALAQTAVSPTRLQLMELAAAVPLAAWAGYSRRIRHESAARSAQHEILTGSLLEHTVRGERARISRELHDVVAHHISMIAVQAETARLTTQDMPAAGAQRLLAIGDTARSALTEMRRLLGVLREDAAAELAQRSPQPGLQQLNGLLDEARDASGAGTRLIVSGWPTPLDPGVELAAYRIVQEALTNTRRHAPGAAVDVELRYTSDGLHLRIRDNGPGPATAPADGIAVAGEVAASHGLLGMRERAAAVGGSLRTGVAPGGGFLVEATLPAKAEEDAA
jgi:signal transduction histidine kinase